MFNEWYLKVVMNTLRLYYTNRMKLIFSMTVYSIHDP